MPLHQQPGVLSHTDQVAKSLLSDLTYCKSNLRNRIVIGDHQIPHLLGASHDLVFGHPETWQYDGLHLHGSEGQNTFQASILNIMRKAGLIKVKDVGNVPAGRKVNSTDAVGQSKTSEDSGISEGRNERKPMNSQVLQQEYDPMEMFRQRHSIRKKLKLNASKKE